MHTDRYCSAEGYRDAYHVRSLVGNAGYPKSAGSGVSTYVLYVDPRRLVPGLRFSDRFLDWSRTSWGLRFERDPPGPYR